MKKQSVRKKINLWANISNHLLRKFLSLCVLYVALSFVFIAILIALLLYTPAISIYLLSGSGELSFLTTPEASHMQDVYFVVRGGMALAFIVGIILILYDRYKKIDYTIVHDGFLMSLVLILFLIPFNYTFTWFHNIFFPQGNWQFSPGSWLISHYSQMFFICVAVLWLAITSLGLWLLSRRQKRLK